MLLARLQCSSITPFAISTLRSKPTSANRPHNAWRNTFRLVVQSFIWILASCSLPTRTTNGRIKPPTGLFLLYDGYSAHLVIVDGASRRVWVLLTKSKDPLIDILRAFMSKYGLKTGLVQTDQGGEFARSSAFRTTMLNEFGYVVKSTGADSPSQNGGAEIYNNALAVKVRTLLYGSGLPAKFWSAALLHAVYLHNRLVHSAINQTPYEA